MAELEGPEDESLAHMYDFDDPESRARRRRHIIDLRDRFELIRRQELEARLARNVGLSEAEREVIRIARVHVDNLEQLRDLMLRDSHNLRNRYTIDELVKKIIEKGPDGDDPDVTKIFETYKNAKMTFENMRRVSEMFAPHIPPERRDGMLAQLKTFDQLVACLPELIDMIYGAIFELERHHRD